MHFRLSHPVSGTGANWPISRKVASHAASAMENPWHPWLVVLPWKIWVNGKDFFHLWKIIQIFEKPPTRLVFPTFPADPPGHPPRFPAVVRGSLRHWGSRTSLLGSLEVQFQLWVDIYIYNYIWLVVHLPLWKIWVSWDDYSQYMEKLKKCSKPPTRDI